MKTIIEGMYQDNVGINWDVYETEIPKDANRVLAVNKLDLVGTISSEGYFFPKEFDDGCNVNEVDIHYCPFTRIQSPMTLVAEDGRVYHDRGLSDKKRLPLFLDLIKKSGGLKQAISKLEN